MSNVSESERWILNFYRHSEITGAMFFGRLAQYIKDPEIKHDLTKHFADESAHAWYWEKCINDLGFISERSPESYQDKYFQIIGVPTNLMEILVITNVFEKRVISQYNRHMHLNNIEPLIKETFQTIMIDEAWHVKWISGALKGLVAKGIFTQSEIDQTTQKYEAADQEVYQKFEEEYKDRLSFLINQQDV